MKKTLSLIATAVPAIAVAQERPNILMIMTDDQGWGDVTINGNDDILTPVQDSLHNCGTVLDNYYASPLSATTRASLLTGRYHLRTGAYFVQNGTENMNPEETTIAEILGRNGYATGCFGKWHNGAYFPYSPNGQGFDEFLGFCSGHWSNYTDPELQHNEWMTEGEGFISDIFTDAAIDFIDANKDRPFLCYVPYNAPHGPMQLTDEYFNRCYDRLSSVKDEKMRTYLATIYGMVENVDWNIGRLLAHLEECGLDKNTIVVFMSDNGPGVFDGMIRYNGDMKGTKGSVYEGGSRVPCYIWWPGHIGHQIITEPASVVDIMPTLLDYCGIRKYKTAFPIDGISLKDRISGAETKIGERNIYTHRYVGKELNPKTGAVRTSRYRLCIDKNETSMYDIQNDPLEKQDIYDPENDFHKNLLEDYISWFEEASEGVSPSVIVPVGYKEAPQVRIPAPEFNLSGNLKVYGAPNCNWVNHFQTSGDAMTVRTAFARGGRYKVSVMYGNPDDRNACTVTCELDGERRTSPLPYFKSEVIPTKTRLFKKTTALPQTWNMAEVGEFKLSRGNHDLKIYVEGAGSDFNVEIFRVFIERLEK